jgi:hypothetical protein
MFDVTSTGASSHPICYGLSKTPPKVRHILSTQPHRRNFLCVQLHFLYAEFGSQSMLKTEQSNFITIT